MKCMFCVGIGRSIAIALQERGAHVVALSLVQSELDDLKRQVLVQ